MIVKVKNPDQEFNLLRQGQILFAYLHLAPDPDQTEGQINSGCIAIAYETVTDAHGGIPLLAPMSKVAGRLSIQVGAHYLERSQGGSGILLGGVAGVAPGKVLILGGGAAGSNAARMAVGMGAQVTILDKNPHRISDLDTEFQGHAQIIYSSIDTVEHYVTDADGYWGGVNPGALAPRLVTRKWFADEARFVVWILPRPGGC